MRLEGVIGKGEGAIDREDQANFFSSEKERKLCKKRKRKRRRGSVGEGG